MGYVGNLSFKENIVAILLGKNATYHHSSVCPPKVTVQSVEETESCEGIDLANVDSDGLHPSTFLVVYIFGFWKIITNTSKIYA